MKEPTMTEIYYRASDLAAALSDLLISPWAKRWIDDYADTAGVQEALHFVLDMVNGKAPTEWKIPAADVAEVVRCKDCDYWDRGNGEKRKCQLLSVDT